MKRSSRRPEPRGFALLEVLIALAALAFIATAFALPLATQANLRRHDETRRLLADAQDAILGFAAAQGRLPCPAIESSAGLEAFGPGGDASNGECATFSGYAPAAALGLIGLDAQGLARDAWATDGNRLRYAVDGGTVNGVTRTLTRVNGLQMATLPGIGAAAHHLYVCRAVVAGAADCGPAANQLTRRAAFVLLSTGPNGGLAPEPGSDEARNAAATTAFVSRDAGPDFDDLVTWGSIHAVVNRMVVAGRLP
jgi:prepilin-type N-terminal cleavage/methylation domain-containing protein